MHSRMTEMAARTSLKPYVGIVGAVTTVVVGLVAQPKPADRLVFEETGRLHGVPSPAPERVTKLESLPKQFTAGEYSPDYARRLLVSSMAGSIAVADFDGDGYPDLDVVVPGGSNHLLRNNGDGTFRDVTARAKVSGPGNSLSATFSDYDRSGRPSLFVASAGGVVVYHNNGDGTFSDVTQKAGLASRAGELHTSVVLDDVDNDGCPDLFVSTYTDLNRLPAKTTFTFPNDFAGAVSRLYRNDCNGAFTDVTAAAGLAENPGRARNAVFADFNNDRHPDLLILRDDKPPALYVNRGNGSFKDVTWAAGEAFTSHAFFDAIVTDFDRDGKLDVALWSTMSFRVLLNRGNATFERATSLPLIPPMASPFGFHGAVADLDGDGFPDVLTVDNKAQLRGFLNHAGTFREVSLTLPPEFESDYLSPLRFKGFRGVQLLAVHSGGRIALLGLKGDGTGR